jgi:hypothetical protein
MEVDLDGVHPASVLPWVLIPPGGKGLTDADLETRFLLDLSAERLLEALTPLDVPSGNLP